MFDLDPRDYDDARDPRDPRNRDETALKTIWRPQVESRKVGGSNPPRSWSASPRDCTIVL